MTLSESGTVRRIDSAKPALTVRDCDTVLSLLNLLAINGKPPMTWEQLSELSIAINQLQKQVLRVRRIIVAADKNKNEKE